MFIACAVKSSGWDTVTATDLASCKTACAAATNAQGEKYQWAVFEDSTCSCVEYVLHGNRLANLV